MSDNPAFDAEAAQSTTKNDDPAFQTEYSEPKDVAYAKIDMEKSIAAEEYVPATAPYAGMGKEDLLRFSQTPFWNGMRLGFLIFFWLGWLALLAAVIGLTITLPRCNKAPSRDWWQKSVMYQVYVRSFQDTNGDGIGDLKGIEQRLDYIKELNVDTLILSSIYRSHGSADGDRDFGYDVIDHQDIDPDYGTMADFDSLLKQAHDKDLQVVLDFIPNHTGSKHPWFEMSRNDSSRTNPYWNYYVWVPCTWDTPPNNWLSRYGNSSWEYDSTRDECYLHQFLPTQPELNLRSSTVKDELEDILRFWLEKGVDGFRVNSVAFLFEDADLRDEPPSGECTPGVLDYRCLIHTRTSSQPELHDLVGRWRAILEEYTSSADDGSRSRILITDAHVGINETMKYYFNNGRAEANLPINYQLTNLSPGCDGTCVFNLVDQWIDNMPRDIDATADWLTGSQDLPRLEAVLSKEYASAMHLLLFTLPGTPLTYYGQELGMVNGTNVGQDPAGKINPEWSRDPYRTPMQWDNTTHAGFVNGTGTPWLPVNADYLTVNVKFQATMADSVLQTFKDLAMLHRENSAFHYGNMVYTYLDGNIFSFVREFDGIDRFLVAINFGSAEGKVEVDYEKSHYMVPGRADVVAKVGGAEYDIGKSYSLKNVKLGPAQGVVFKWAFNR